MSERINSGRQPGAAALHRALLGRSAGAYLLVGWLGLLVFLVFGRSLSFPFFSDDFFQLPFLDAHSIGELWRTAEGLFFFRPLAFSLWKGWYWLLGEYQPAAFHALNLLLHWLNGVLVFWLTARLWPGRNSRLKAGIAATMFTLFPFSYEGVAWVAAVMHPFFLALTLLSVAAFLQTRHSKRPGLWLAAGLICTLLSPFAHENGVLTGPLVMVIALTRPNDDKPKISELLKAGLWLVPVLFWFVVWQQVPARDGSGGLSLNEPQTMFQNGLYFLQGLGYPLAWLGGRLRDLTALDSTGAALAASLPGVLVLLFVRWRLGFSLRALLPWLWTAVSVAPPILFLPNLHVIAAPRMFMLPAAGITWLWIEAFWYLYVGRGKMASYLRFPRHYRLGIAAVLLLALLWQNVSFISKQLDLYHIGGTAIAETGLAAVEADEAGRPSVFINLPAWIAPLRATYAIGQEGDNLILGPDMVEPLVWTQTGQRVTASAVRYDDIRVTTPYYTGPVGEGPDWAEVLGQGAAVYSGVYGPDKIDVEAAGIVGLAVPGFPPLVVYGESVWLVAGTAEVTGNHTVLKLTWMVTDSTPFEATVFVHGLDDNGQLVVQADGDPIAGTFPIGLWPAGTVVQDIRTVPTREAQYFLVGLYNRQDGTRAMAVRADGQPLTDNAFRIQVGDK